MAAVDAHKPGLAQLQGTVGLPQAAYYAELGQVVALFTNSVCRGEKTNVNLQKILL